MWRGGGRVLIVVAHPDDETLGFGGEMVHWPDCVIVHTTNGSPANLSDAQTAGFATPEEYASARRDELTCALSEVGGRETHCFGIVDQQSWRDLAGLTQSVRKVIEQIRPTAILSHPYEGGHPDHDATAFAVQLACEAIGPGAPVRLEGAFYNHYAGSFHPGDFIPGLPSTDFQLDAQTRARKNRMFACFHSQRRVLTLFTTEWERYRYAPKYDFTQPPHKGTLGYETFGWGITSAMWIESAGEASRSLSQ